MAGAVRRAERQAESGKLAGAAMSNLSHRIVGSWKMLSWTYEVVETGEVHDALGKDPKGYTHYLPDGRMMVLVLKPDRLMPASLVPTAAEKLALYDSMFAYAGTYSVAEDRVIHHIDMSWNRAWEGTDQIRLLTLEGRYLTYTGVLAKNPLDGRDCVHRVRFEKVP
jgi:Lipocalin-like domain